MFPLFIFRPSNGLLKKIDEKRGYDIITNGLEVVLPDDLKLKQIRMKKLEQFWVVPNEEAVTTKSVALKTHYRMENCLN